MYRILPDNGKGGSTVSSNNGMANIENLKTLIEKGKKKGVLTYKEIMDALQGEI